jgi:hypothetical protein
MILTGKIRSARIETCASAILSTTNPTWTSLGLNPDLSKAMARTLLLFATY